jgi:hypothetical protein
MSFFVGSGKRVRPFVKLVGWLLLAFFMSEVGAASWQNLQTSQWASTLESALEYSCIPPKVIKDIQPKNGSLYIYGAGCFYAPPDDHVYQREVSARKYCDDGSTPYTGECIEEQCPANSTYSGPLGCVCDYGGDPNSGAGCNEEPPVECPAYGTPITHRIETTFTDGAINSPSWPNTVTDENGCTYSIEYAFNDPAGGAEECYQDIIGRWWCSLGYGSNGTEPTNNPPTQPDQTERPSDSTETNEKPPTTQATQETETIPDTPEPGDQTTVDTKTETTTKPPYQDVENTEDKTTIRSVTGEEITVTTTTTTTTKPDGTKIETTVIEYQQAPVTETKTEYDWQPQAPPVTKTTVTEYPAKEGTETTVKTTDPSGNVTTQSTTTGSGPSGTGGNYNTDGAGDSPGSGVEGNEEGPEDGFDPAPFGEVKTIGESFTDFNNRVKASPLGTAINNLGASAPTGGFCQVLTLNLYFGTVSTDLHCQTWDTVKGVLSPVMIAAWSFLALFLFFMA